MKAAGGKRKNKLPLLLLVFIVMSTLASAQPAFPGIHLGEVALLTKSHTPAAGFQTFHLLRVSRFYGHSSGLKTSVSFLQPVYLHPTRLPWSEECLPFFCRIEHNWGKNKALPVKFRLGSVEYVDWLEGKSGLSTFAP